MDGKLLRGNLKCGGFRLKDLLLKAGQGDQTPPGEWQGMGNPDSESDWISRVGVSDNTNLARFLLKSDNAETSVRVQKSGLVGKEFSRTWVAFGPGKNLCHVLSQIQ